MPRHRAPFSVVLCGALAGCASVDVLPVRSPDQPGIRYWRPAPYIALAPSVTSGTATCEAKLVMLPDKSQEYAITMQAGIGTAEADPTLDGGWNLVGFTGKADSKTAENITAVGSLIKSAAGVPFSSGGQTETVDETTQSVLRNCKGLFKIVYDPITGALRRFARVDDLGVNFALQPPPKQNPQQKSKQGKSSDSKSFNQDASSPPAVGVSPPLPTGPARGVAPAP